MSKTKTQNVFFCSAASRYFKEDIHGSAANYNGFILLEHSDPFPEKISQAHFDQQFIAALEELAKRKRAKLLLIRNKKTNFRIVKLIYVDCLQQRYFTLYSVPEDLAAIRLEYYIDNPESIWETTPFFVVCTNGKKDKCCSKFGFPVFKFIENHDRQMPVFESTHVGGDRFAANAVCMPFGLYYGRVMVEDVDPILAATDQGAIYYSNYRGLSIRSFLHQSVECFLREHLDHFAIRFPLVVGEQEEEGDLIKLIAAVEGRRFQVIVRKKTIAYPYYLTCKSTKPGNITKYLLEELKELPETV
ncbi:sucrase ferredoxin [Niabella ginsenosidivorans]|uniref:Sucrase ferredoxin n=1 Tax=Niabella ginsenosidivorans TaxID=1176587 RepID=A0A1A9I292_9BACT|nr:sucrase ferredoxin [Niabella ginsenosidivorans]ANH81778.1 sucrase ferredoxin [Niabella ginsenosidivorans]